MKYDLSKFEELYEQGYLRKSEKENLVLYGYTDKCTYDRHWNEYTKTARGLILDKNTGEVVAKPFEKFFNLNEHETTFLKNLPIHLPYEVLEKVDGSLCIIFNHNGYWDVATRGSFYSDQAVKAYELLNKYDLTLIPKEHTLLVEIIYPENKIIVNYGKEERLVLLAVFNRRTGVEVENIEDFDLEHLIGLSFCESYNYTIEEMISLQKTIPKDQEGFVVRFSNGLRVKIKGDEYMRIAKMIAHMSPISFWEGLENGIVNKKYLSQLPEEFKADFEPIVETLEKQYCTIKREVEEDFNKLPTKETSNEGRKMVGLFLKSTNLIKHKSAMFPFLLGKNNHVDRYIREYIRPNANELKEVL